MNGHVLFPIICSLSGKANSRVECANVPKRWMSLLRSPLVREVVQQARLQAPGKGISRGACLESWRLRGAPLKCGCKTCAALSGRDVQTLDEVERKKHVEFTPVTLSYVHGAGSVAVSQHSNSCNAVSLCVTRAESVDLLFRLLLCRAGDDTMRLRQASMASVV